MMLLTAAALFVGTREAQAFPSCSNYGTMTCADYCRTYYDGVTGGGCLQNLEGGYPCECDCTLVGGGLGISDYYCQANYMQ